MEQPQQSKTKSLDKYDTEQLVLYHTSFSDPIVFSQVFIAHNIWLL